MTMEERIQDIEGFGYTPAEAGFLCRVALYGGYFVRRQFLYSVGCEAGKRAQDFIEKGLSKKHIARGIYREGRHLYRLHHKPIYAAIGEPENRNRREHQPSAIRLRLMALDFVLEHPESQFLATTEDKLHCLVDTCQVESGVLPTRVFCVRGVSVVRYFADGFPMFLTGGASPVPSFTFIDDDQVTTGSLRSYLFNYQRLFQTLGSVNLLFVTRHQKRFDSAARTLQRFRDSLVELAEPVIEIQRLLTHFPHRHLFELRQTRPLTTADLNRLRDDLETYVGPRFDRLFELWKQGGDEAVRADLAAEHSKRKSLEITFTPCVLEHDYELFGTLQSAS